MGRVSARPRAAGGGGPQRGRWLHRRVPLRCYRARQVDRATGCDHRRPPGRTGGRHSMSPGIPVLLAMAAMLGACAHAPSKSIADAQARFEGTALAGNVAALDAQRDIVLAVANPIIAPASHAGSNILGSGTPAPYRTGPPALYTLPEPETRPALPEIAGCPPKTPATG